MPLISENIQNKKLKQNNINIKTLFISNNNILEKNSDNSKNDDIEKGIIFEKDYFIKNELVHKEKTFDSRIEYTYIFKDKDEEYNCPNCGLTSKIKDFVDGCPYCKTYYNLDYSSKDLGSKYHYDQILRNTKYRIITAIIDVIVSIILSYFYIVTTSRTFNSYDISKVFIYGLILSLILFYFFYLIDGYIVLGPIKAYKERENQKQKDFWKRTNINQSTFFNNLNYELRNKYYKETNIIDYDILDYLSFNEYTKDNELYVKIKLDIRLIYFENNKIKSKYIYDEVIMKKTNYETLKLNDGVNIIKCHNCGASIDATAGKCNYCDSEIPYLQEWILIK